MTDQKAIIDEINRGLTGDASRDADFLHACGERYKNHEHSVQILRHIGRLLAQSLSTEQKKEFEAAFRKDLQRLESVLVQANAKLKQGHIAEASDLLKKSDLTEGLSEHLFPEDESTIYLAFDNTLEHAYYDIKFKSAKTLRVAALPFKASYSIAAFIAFEEGDLDRAMRILNKGLKRCPLAADLLFEQCEIYKSRGDMQTMVKTMQENTHCLYQRQDISHYFRNIGYQFVEQKNWKPALCCYGLSLHWHQTEAARRELGYIAQESKMTFDEVMAIVENYAECTAILEHEKISIMPVDPLWIKLSWHLAEEAERNNNHVFAAECFHIHYGLTNSEAAELRMNECVSRAKAASNN